MHGTAADRNEVYGLWHSIINQGKGTKVRLLFGLPDQSDKHIGSGDFGSVKFQISSNQTHFNLVYYCANILHIERPVLGPDSHLFY